MSQHIPSHTRYVPLTQQRYCCTPTCIQMVMLKHKLPLIAAEELGHYMGLAVPPEEAHLFWDPPIGEKPAAGYGTQIGKEEYNLNACFERLHIPLHYTYRSIDEFDTYLSLQQYLAESVSADKDVLVCFDWGTMFDRDFRGGHVCVVDIVDMQTETVRIIDPEYKAPKWRVVRIKKLHEAMRVHATHNQAGCWEIART